MIDIVPFWWWFVTAGLIATFELLLPTYFFLWLSAACFFTGLIAWIFPEIELWQDLSIFAVLAIGIVYVGKIYKRKITKGKIGELSDLLNNRLGTYTGRITPLTKKLSDNYGEVRLDDMPWKVKSKVESLPVGTKVKITGVDGMTLMVEPFDS